MIDRCPMCRRPYAPAKTPQRICGACKGPIAKGHKYYFDESVIKHRDCNDPESYPRKQEPTS